MKKKYNNISDEELDRLFRDAAERYRPPNAPEGAWEAFLNGHLNIQEPLQFKKNEDRPPEKEKKKAILTILAWPLKIAACLLIVAGGFWLLNRKSVDKVPDPLVQINKPVEDNIDSSKAQAIAAPAIEPMPPAITHSTVKAQSRQENKTDPAPAITTTQINDGTNMNEATEVPSRLEENNYPNNHLPADDNSNTKQRKQNPGILITESKPSVDHRPVDHLFALKSSGAKDNNKNSKWQLGILGGSNLSMVSGTVSGQPGFNAGVIVQKKLGNSRISLESGVIYESMAYSVDNKDFNPGGNPVSSKVSNVEGNCSMIDVPVNIRYDVIETKKGKAFVSTGVSPTVIVKQSYIYQFERADGPVQVKRDVTGDGKDFYAVANLSIGYEQKWNRTSVQIAPYVKIPAGEIGYGNLRLGGVGTQISLKRDL